MGNRQSGTANAGYESDDSYDSHDSYGSGKTRTAQRHAQARAFLARHGIVCGG